MTLFQVSEGYVKNTGKDRDLVIFHTFLTSADFFQN